MKPIRDAILAEIKDLVPEFWNKTNLSENVIIKKIKSSNKRFGSCSVYFIDAEDQPYVLKYYCDSTAYCKREHLALDLYLKESEANIPTVVAVGSDGSRSCLIYDRILGTPMDRLLPQQKTEWLSTILTSIRSFSQIKFPKFGEYWDICPISGHPGALLKYVTAFSDDCMKNITTNISCEDDIKFLQRIYMDGIDAIQQLETDCTFAHGDLRFDNIIKTNDDVAIIDFGHSLAFCAEFDLAKLLVDIREDGYLNGVNFVSLVSNIYGWSQWETEIRIRAFYWFVVLRRLNVFGRSGDKHRFKMALKDARDYYN